MDSKKSKEFRRFRRAYKKYVECIDNFGADCGLSLLLHVSATASSLRREAENAHKKLKAKFPEVPNFEYMVTGASK